MAFSSVPVKGTGTSAAVPGTEGGLRAGQDRGGTISGRWRPPGSPSRIRERSRIITRAGGQRRRHPRNKSAPCAHLAEFLTCPPRKGGPVRATRFAPIYRVAVVIFAKPGREQHRGKAAKCRYGRRWKGPGRILPRVAQERESRTLSLARISRYSLHKEDIVVKIITSFFCNLGPLRIFTEITVHIYFKMKRKKSDYARSTSTAKLL